MERHIHIFTDGSVNVESKQGYGAYLILHSLDKYESLESIKGKVEVKCFEQTSSTKLELQILLHALRCVLNSNKPEDVTLNFYTDSQNIVGLPNRKEKLEKNDYYSGNGKKLNNFELYQEFYRLTNGLDFKIMKIAGHQPTRNKNEIDKIFSLVDKAARRFLRGGSYE